MKAQRVLVAGICAVALLLNACTATDPPPSDADDTTLPANPASSDAVQITPHRAATATAGSITVTIPKGAVDGNGLLRAAPSSSPTDVPGAAELGPAVAVDLTGSELTGRASVAFEVPSHWSARDLVPVVAWQQPDSSWRWLPTVLHDNGTVAVARTEHFSMGVLLGFDGAKLARDTFGTVRSWATGRAQVADPYCDGESVVRQDVTVQSDNGDSVKWCLGRENGRTIVRVANNRLLYTQVSYPTAWTNLTGAKVGLSWDRALEAAATGIEQLAYRKAKRSVFLLSPKATMTIAVPDGDTGRVTAKGTPAAFFAQMLKTSLDMVFTLRGSAGVSKGATTTDKVLALLGDGTEGNTEWAIAAYECLESFSDEFTNDMVEPVTNLRQLQRTATFATTCGAAIGSVSLSDSGPVAWPIAAAVSTVIAVYSIVSTLLTHLVGASRETFDGIRSFSSNVDDASYDIEFAAKNWVLTPGRVGPLYAGMHATDAVRLGVTVSDTSTICNRRWQDTQTNDGSIRWLTYREGDPDRIDNAFFMEGPDGQRPSIRTREGIGVGSTIEAVQSAYGSRLQTALFQPEGDVYRGYVVFGRLGAMMFTVDLASNGRPVDNLIDTIQMNAGTSLADVSFYIGGC